jgi:hypothetical protein
MKLGKYRHGLDIIILSICREAKRRRVAVVKRGVAVAILLSKTTTFLMSHLPEHL